VPAAVLLHGYASRKEDMAESVGVALLPLGIASLSIDLPLHGDRSDPLELRSMRNPFDLADRWRTAIEEGRLALRFLSEPKEIQWWDAGHRLPDAAVLQAAAWLERQLRQP
jgi:hypothetical protein